MNIRIYQSYYDRKQARHLDPAFVSFDNTQNFLPELREYPVIQNVRHRCVLDHVDLFGMFSWKFGEKMKGMSGKSVIQHIQDNPGYDAYFFNPFAHDNPYIYNIWEHADWCHAGILDVLEPVFLEMGLDPQVIFEPMAHDHMTWCNFIVANQKFWDKWLYLVNSYSSAIPNLPLEIRRLHDSNSGYKLDNLSYFPFIAERMASTLAHMDPDIRVCTYHNKLWSNFPDDLHHTRQQAIETNDPELWQKWLDQRDGMLANHRQTYPNVTDLARKWLDVAQKQQPILFD